MKYKIISKSPQITWINKELLTDRIDNSYYNTDFIKMDIENNQIESVKLKDLLDKPLADFGSFSLTKKIKYQEEGIPYIRSTDFKEFFIDESKLCYISEDVDNLLYKSRVFVGDILITKMGSDMGKAAYISNLPYQSAKCNSNATIAKVRVKEGIDKYYLVTYLNSKYSLVSIWRNAVGSVQPRVNLSDIEEFEIPIPEKKIQVYIGDKIRKSEDLNTKSKTLKKELETLFEDSINININEIINNQSKWTFIKESDINEDNISACYYKQQYLDIEKKLDETGINLIELERLTNAIKLGNTKKISDHYCDNGIPYITTKNITKDGMDLSKLIFVPNQISNAYLSKSKAYPNDVLYNKSGNVGLSSILSDEYKQYNVVSDIIIIRPNTEKIDPYYLNVFLNSKLGKLASERMAGGAIFQHISIYDVGKIKVPMLPYYLQQEIGSKKKEAEQCERKANKLIEEAKRDIEDLIEGSFDMSKLNK